MSEENKSRINIAAFIVKQFKNRNIFIFLGFVIMAAFLWLLNAVNKEHDTQMEIPYKFENLPAKTKISKESDNDLIVLIHGHGYNLLREKIEKVKLPVVIDFTDVKHPVVFHKCINNPVKSYILTKDIIPFLSRRFGSNIKVTGVEPDTLFFDVAESFSRKVPVILTADFETEAEFMINGKVILNPDSINVYGPKHITDTIKAVYTDKTNLGKLGEMHIKEVALRKIPNISFSKSKILVNVPVEKYTEANISIPVIAVNFPDSLSFELIPNAVSVFYKVPLSLYDKIDKTNFEAVVNYESIKNNQIIVEIVSVNSFLEITKSNPVSVGIILERKK